LLPFAFHFLSFHSRVANQQEAKLQFILSFPFLSFILFYFILFLF
jgi:hypothetical protein